MNKFLKIDPWCIIEEGFSKENHRASESIFSLGNGRFGQRANFEETYTGETLQGNYIAGIYYPDKTKVGWWKNGYPEYFAKVLNAPDWIRIAIRIGNEEVDLNTAHILSFKRILNMKEGLLHRDYHIELSSGRQLRADITRFISMANPEVAAIRYTLTPVNFNDTVTIISILDAGIKNDDANYGEYFWDVISQDVMESKGFVVARTRKTDFDVCIGIDTVIQTIGSDQIFLPESGKAEKSISTTYTINTSQNKKVTIYKYASVLSSLYHSKRELRKDAEKVLSGAVETGFDDLLKDHTSVWISKWEHSDITIEGDDEAQQAIRFTIFHLNQTYTGDDERLNVGPKGFTGEKYGGSTYWDTEAYCLPFFLCTAPSEVSRNLLLYRYKHLAKAIENGKKLGFTGGAALYPMVTMNGEECHNEWEITFEEIHRNGAIAYAIYNYITHTNDHRYLIDYGLEVLIAISRFWKQRVNYSKERKKFVILGVTGPNEYENNVNNNWYTNTIATWTLDYTIKAIEFVRNSDKAAYNKLIRKVSFNEATEMRDWKNIIDNMYFPVDEKRGIFLQQDGYMDKEQMTADALDPAQRPINQHWSWDRILRSCFIKQADVLQGIYLFGEKYDVDTVKRNFDFYESRCVHESSLSSCVHSILAARIGEIEKAYELYLHTSRLDLDDYNNEVDEGLHITSMAGTWMSVVEGFAGKHIVNGKLMLKPQIPARWKGYSFTLMYRGSLLNVHIKKDSITIINESDIPVTVLVYDNEYQITGFTETRIIREDVYVD